MQRNENLVGMPSSKSNIGNSTVIEGTSNRNERSGSLLNQEKILHSQLDNFYHLLDSSNVERPPPTNRHYSFSGLPLTSRNMSKKALESQLNENTNQRRVTMSGSLQRTNAVGESKALNARRTQDRESEPVISQMKQPDICAKYQYSLVHSDICPDAADKPWTNLIDAAQFFLKESPKSPIPSTDRRRPFSPQLPDLKEVNRGKQVVGSQKERGILSKEGSRPNSAFLASRPPESLGSSSGSFTEASQPNSERGYVVFGGPMDPRASSPHERKAKFSPEALLQEKRNKMERLRKASKLEEERKSACFGWMQGLPKGHGKQKGRGAPKGHWVQKDNWVQKDCWVQKDKGSRPKKNKLPNTMRLATMKEDEKLIIPVTGAGNFADTRGNSISAMGKMSAKLFSSEQMREYCQFMGVNIVTKEVRPTTPASFSFRNNITKMTMRHPGSMDYSNTEGLGTTVQEIRTDTPDTFIADVPCFPDMGIYCTDCMIYTRIENVNDHRTYHKALKDMRFKGASRPQNLAELQKRRNLILRKLHKSTLVAKDKETLDPNQVQRVNHAYEVLKSDLEDTQETERSVTVPKDYKLEGQSLDCSLNCVLGVGVCSYDNSRWKSYMEDTKVFQDYFGNDPRKCFLGIYDGHHGKFAADIAAHELHHALLREIQAFDKNTKCTCAFNMAECNDISQYRISQHLLDKENTGKHLVHSESSNNILQVMHKCGDNIYDADLIKVHTEKIDEQEALKKERRTPRSPDKSEKPEFSENMKLAFKKSFYRVDRLLSYGKNEHSRVRWSGCSAVAAVVIDCEKSEEIPLHSVVENVEGENQNGESLEVGTEDVSEKDEKEIRKLGTLYVANAGDSQAILVRANHAYRISRDHSLKNTKEKTRIEKMGGFASESERQLRVNGLLTATRGLGNHGDPKLKTLVSPEPQCASVPIDQYAQFLILASNGLWEVFSPDEAADLISQMLPCNEIPPPSVPSSSLSLFISRYNQHLQMSDSAENITQPPQYSLGGTIFEEDDEAELQYIADEDEDDLSGSTNELTQDENENINKIGRTFSDQIDRLPSALRRLNESGNNTQDDRRLSFANDAQVNTYDGTASESGSNRSVHESGHEGDIDTVTDMMSHRAIDTPGSDFPTRVDLQKEFAQNMAKRLVHAALIAGARDNISCMIVLFPGSGI